MIYRTIIIFLCLFFIISCGGNSSSNTSSNDDWRYTNIGRSPLALTSPNFECNDFIESIQELPVWHIAFLFNTFGNDFSCLERLKQDRRLSTLVIHLINEPGHRNRRLGSYEFLASISSPSEYDRLLKSEDSNLKNRFVAYSQPVVNIVQNLPRQTDCVISAGLESNVSIEASRVLVRWTRELFPSCRILWNPLGPNIPTAVTASLVNADLAELHTKTPQVSAPCFVNTDGVDISLPGRPSFARRNDYLEHGDELENYVVTYTNRCELVFLWVHEDNCINAGAFVDPRSRNCTTARQNRVNHLLVDEIKRIAKK